MTMAKAATLEQVLAIEGEYPHVWQNHNLAG